MPTTSSTRSPREIKASSIKGEEIEKAFISYMGMNEEQDKPLPVFTNMEIGGGRMTGTETTADSGSRDFALYHADQYMAPTPGTFDTVQSVDGATWYKQYAQPAVNKTPYETEDEKMPTTNPLSKNSRSLSCNKMSRTF